MLERIIPTGLVDAIDIELFFDQDRMLKTIEFAKVHGITIIMSNHDFNGTPSHEVIVNRLLQMKEFLADVPKMAVMPNTTGDVLTSLKQRLKLKPCIHLTQSLRWLWDHSVLLHVLQVLYLVML